MRVAYIAAGAAGMYCGSCIHDNTLVAALQHQGLDIALIPTYTPLRTDEDNVSIDRVFYGGINVYLQQKFPRFRHAPTPLVRLLDHPRMLGLLSHLRGSTGASALGALTVNVLAGETGRQRRELETLTGWLARDYRPDLVILTNSLFVGLARYLKSVLKVPVLCGLQGEDLFLNQIVEPYRTQAMDLLRCRATDVDAFIAPCTYYRDFMSTYLEVATQRIHVVPLGLNLSGHGSANPPPRTPWRVGYMARICPEKGFHVLAEAFHLLVRDCGEQDLYLDVAGYLDPRDRAYFTDTVNRINDWGLSNRFTYRGEVDRKQKIQFLSSLHTLSVPTTYPDPKGIFVLEALANGVPCVEPNHGAFPELLEQTGGLLLVEPTSPQALAAGLATLVTDQQKRLALAASGRKTVHQRLDAATMATATRLVFEKYLST